MTLKIKSLASETIFIDEESFSVVLLLSSNRISNSLKEEIRLFAKRNSLAKRNSVNECCPRCLKAHLIKHAKQSPDLLQALLVEEFIPFEAGHHGYYMDAEEVIKI